MTEETKMNDRPESRHTGRAIRDEIRIEAPPEVVYQAWADPDTVSDWFVSRAEGRMQPGETVYWSWDVEGEGMTHCVIEAEAPRQILLELGVPQGVTLLEITIEQEGGHSLVRLVQSGFGHGPEWDDQYEGMLSGWMVALAVLKHFAERYYGRKRSEIILLKDAEFDREGLLELQRSERGLSRWLTRSGAPGEDVGEPVRLVLADGRTLTGTVLRQTRYETLWSWDEIDGVFEIKAFRGPAWGSKVGVRVMSWLDDISELADLRELLGNVLDTLVALLG